MKRQQFNVKNKYFLFLFIHVCLFNQKIVLAGPVTIQQIYHITS